MLPFLLIILHFSQIGFTDDLTFTVISPFLRSLFPSVLPVYTPKPGPQTENSNTGCQYLYIDTLNGHNTSVPTKFAWALYHHYPWKSSIFSTNFLYFFLYFLGIFTKYDRSNSLLRWVTGNPNSALLRLGSANFWRKFAYLSLQMIRPLDKSYGDISSVTLSPGRILI